MKIQEISGLDALQRYIEQQQINEKAIWADTVRFFNNFTIPILRSIAKTFVTTASRYSPPGKRGKKLGTASIATEKYYCRIIDLIASQKDPNVKKRPRKEDFPYIQKGYKYKVLRNKYRQKMQVIGYAKSLRTAKRMARIKNRGLAKYSWGTLLMNFRGKNMATSPNEQLRFEGYEGNLSFNPQNIPTFRLLAQKSPNITRYRWGAIWVKEDIQHARWSMRLKNDLADSNAYCRIAVRRGTKAAKNRWYALIKALNGHRRGLFKNLLK